MSYGFVFSKSLLFKIMYNDGFLSYHSFGLPHSCSHTQTPIRKFQSRIMSMHTVCAKKLLFSLYKSHKRLQLKALYLLADVMRGKLDGLQSLYIPPYLTASSLTSVYIALHQFYMVLLRILYMLKFDKCNYYVLATEMPKQSYSHSAAKYKYRYICLKIIW